MWKNWNNKTPCLKMKKPSETELKQQEQRQGQEQEQEQEQKQKQGQNYGNRNIETQNEPIAFIKLQQQENMMKPSTTGSAYDQPIHLTPEEQNIAQRRPTKKKLIQKYRKALSMRPITEKMVIKNKSDRFNRALDKIHKTVDISNNPRRILRENQNSNVDQMQHKLKLMMKTMQDANVPINPELANAMYDKK